LEENYKQKTDGLFFEQAYSDKSRIGMYVFAVMKKVMSSSDYKRNFTRCENLAMKKVFIACAIKNFRDHGSPFVVENLKHLVTVMESLEPGQHLTWFVMAFKDVDSPYAVIDKDPTYGKLGDAIFRFFKLVYTEEERLAFVDYYRKRKGTAAT